MAASGSELPARERIYDDGLWRVAHVFNSTLPGWLVVLSARHVTTLAQLTPAEAGALGPLLRRLTAALAEVTGCERTYVALFAEAAGFEHLHLHVVPRLPDLPDDRLGPAVFGYLTDDQAKWLPEPERDRLARRLAGALASGSG